MAEQRFLHKLVRDKVPELLKAKGIDIKVHEANHDEFEIELLEKLREEVLEFKNNKSQEQLADLLEVIEALTSLEGWTKEQIEEVRRLRHEEKGGFSKRLILENTE